MWHVLPFAAGVVLACADAALTVHASDINAANKNNIHGNQTYQFENVLVQMNCRNNFKPFRMKMRIRVVLIEVCTSAEYKGYDASYYKNALENYNISSHMQDLTVAYVTLKNSTDVKNMIKPERYAIFGPEAVLERINNCEYLQELNLTNVNLSKAPDGILKPCPQLRKLNIQYTNVTLAILKRVLSGISLWELSLRDCNLYELPDDFINLLQELRRLDLSHNHLRFVSFVSELKPETIFRNLEFLDLSHNELIYGTPRAYTAVLMPRLQYMIVDHNPRLDVCNLDYFIDDAKSKENRQWFSIELPELRILSASFTRTSRLCFGHIGSEDLVLLNISNSQISTLSVQGLPKFAALNFTMDLQGNNIIDIQKIGINEYEAMKEKLKGRSNTKTKIIANVNQLQCDCKYSWLQKVLKDFSTLEVQDISCSDGIQLIHQEPSRLNCTKFDCGDCVCRRYGISTNAHCSSGLTRTIPMVENLSHLNAASNRIESLNVSLFTDTLVWVDLRANRISRLDLETTRAMFSESDRLFRLAGNPIICDCKNQGLLEILRFHRHQIIDYAELTCAGSEVTLIDTKESKICDSEHWILETTTLVIVLATICVAIVILALITFIYYRYGRQCKIFLYARGWLLCCIRECDIDNDRPYDVFISFAHEDELFVTDELMPGLEIGPSVFKTCVHLRDWIPGEMIPNQIVTSVQRSRRTIVVVSKSFLKSLWGLMEFRTAHASATCERRFRVIIVLLEDVSENDILDPELRWYMRTNTYLRWGDPWFWDKLRYALPHKPIQSSLGR